MYLKVPMVGTSGEILMLQMVKAKIVNAEDIIAKLKVNKDGFIGDTTHRQILAL